MLDRVRRQAGGEARGRHRVYLGIAPGVGKTYTALEELHRRKQRGTDVVIGFLETHGRARTAELEKASDEYAEQVSQAVASDVETAAYVEELEQRADQLGAEEELPSGDSIAAELTRFLREREAGNGGQDDPPHEQ